MNLLQLVQAAKREAGISGANPVTVQNPVEEVARVVGWVNAAWLDIQTLHNEWEFMRGSFSFNTVAGQGEYTPVQAGVYLPATPTVSNLGSWKKDSFRKYLDSNGSATEAYLPFLEYNTFRNMYLFGAMRTQRTAPATFSVNPGKNLVIGNLPDDVYNINGEYFAMPGAMALDVDTPNMPAQFHMAIVWKALAHYGMYEAASEAVQKGEREYSRLLSRLEADQLPMITFGAPLA
jgi:hypothetical protein